MYVWNFTLFLVLKIWNSSHLKSTGFVYLSVKKIQSEDPCDTEVNVHHQLLQFSLILLHIAFILWSFYGHKIVTNFGHYFYIIDKRQLKVDQKKKVPYFNLLPSKKWSFNPPYFCHTSTTYMPFAQIFFFICVCPMCKRKVYIHNPDPLQTGVNRVYL